MKFVLNDNTSNWQIKKMPDVVKWGSGGTPKATIKEYYEGGTIPWLIIGDLNDGLVTESATKITELGLENSSAKLIPKGTLLVAMYGSIGKLGITGIECCTNQAIAYAKELYGVTTEFMYYQMMLLKSELISKGKGGTQKNISQTVLNSLDVIVPPLEEQKRIVARIEELFSELDAAVATLERTKEQLAVYRQAVLKEAFGKHTDTVKISSLCSVVRGGSPRPAGDERYYNGSIPFLKVADLTQNSGVYLSRYTYTIKEAGLKKTRLVPANTLLISNSGATLGVPKICTFQTTLNDGVAAFLNLDITKEHLPYHYYFWLSKIPEMRAINQGAAQPNLNTTIIGDVDIPYCSYQQQESTANELEAKLSVCDKIEETVTTALREAEAMRQSILKRAFAGEL